MRIYPVTSYTYLNYSKHRSVYAENKRSTNTCNPAFCAHEAKKTFTAIFGTTAAVSAALGSVLLSGGLALPFVLTYSAIGTAAGFGIGCIIDKNEKEINSKNKKAD